MPHTIAVAGKGGVGKTTTCGMLIDYLCKKKKGPVLVVDADANSNLNEVLGVEVETSLGAIREEIAKHGLELLGVLPQDEGVYNCDSEGEPSSKLPQTNPVKQALKGIMQNLGI